MNKPRVVILGNKQIAVRCLEQLLLWEKAGELELVAFVACHDDDPNAETWWPSAKAFALSHDVPVHQPNTINSPAFFPVLKGLAPDAMISTQYDRILKPHVIEIPPLGVANIHFAPLPKYRGVFPLVWALIEGGPSGVTMHGIDPGIDTGDIIAQTLLPISDTDNAWTLYERATEAGFELFQEYFLAFLRGEAPRTPQFEAEASYFSVGYPYDRWIDWSQSATQVDRFIRALTFPPYPYPSARTSLAGSEVEVLQPARPVETSIDAAPGTILTVGEVLTVATGSGILEISRLRMGGKVVKASEVADRLDLSPGLRFESQDWIALRP